MKYIEYEYVPWTEVADVGRGQIKAEKNIRHERVSSTTYPPAYANPNNDPNWYRRTETRGDGRTRTIYYAYNPAPNVFGISWTDFKNYTSSDQCLPNRDGWQITDARGNATIYHTENFIDAVDKIIYPQTDPLQAAGTKEYIFSDSQRPYYHFKEKDENGIWTYFDRDGNNRVWRIRYANGIGSTEEFTYNGFGQVLTHKLRSGGIENFRYDTRGRKTEYWPPATPSDPNPEAHKTLYTYYEPADGHPAWIDRLKSVKDPLDHYTRYEYNQRGQITKVTHHDGSYTQSAYNLDGTLAWTADENHPGAATDPNQRTRFEYDEYKRVRFVTNPMGERTENWYGLNPITWGDELLHTTNNVKWTKSPMGKAAVFGYDENLRKSYQIAAYFSSDEAWTWFYYDEVGNLIRTTDPRQKETNFGYDQRNRKIWMNNPIASDRNSTGHTMNWAYDGVGNQTRETRADGAFRTWRYNIMNELWFAYDWRTNETPTAEQTTAYDHDDAGNVQVIIDQKGAWYQYQYDALNRKIGATYPTDATGTVRTETFKYDAAGNLSLYKNPANQYKHLDYADSYDSRNRLRHSAWNTSSSNGAVDWNIGPETRTDYDNASRMTQVTTNGSETVVAFVYDTANRLLWEDQTVTGSTRRVQHDRDTDGNAINTHIPGWYLNWFHYNQRNQVDQIQDGGGTPWFNFSYDAAGNMTKRQAVYGGVNDSLNVPSQYYDALNRPTRWENTGPGDTMFARSWQQYDSVGRMTATWRDEESSKGERFDYNVRSQVTKATYKADQAWTTTPQYPQKVQDFQVDALNRQSASDTGPPVVNGLAASYYNGIELSGQPVTRTDGTVNFAWNMASPAPGIAGEWFSARWEGQVMPAYSQTYTFYTQADDGVRLWVNGQLLVNDWNYHGTLEYSGTVALVAGQKYNIKMEYFQGCCGATAALLWSSPSQRKEIIPQSRLFVPAGGNYQANGLNQYTKVGVRAVGYDGNFNITSYDGGNFRYNAQNQMVSGSKGGNTVQFIYDGTGRCLKRITNGFGIIFAYDGWKPIAEWAGDGSYWGFRVYGSGPDEVLWHYDSRVGYMRVHSDLHGNVMALLDWYGNGVEKYTYDAFGKPKITGWSGSGIAQSSVYNRFMFQGREYIPELGIYDYRHRMYLPELGRFLQIDPTGFDGGDMNLFRYCDDDPVDRSDPMGLYGENTDFETAVHLARVQVLRAVTDPNRPTRTEHFTGGKYSAFAGGYTKTYTPGVSVPVLRTSSGKYEVGKTVYGSMQRIGNNWYDVEPAPEKGTVMPVHTHNNTSKGVGTPYWSQLDKKLPKVERMDEANPGVWHRRTLDKNGKAREETFRDSASQQTSGGSYNSLSQAINLAAWDRTYGTFGFMINGKY